MKFPEETCLCYLAVPISTSISFVRGTFTLQDVLNFGGIAEKQKVSQMQYDLQFDDPINIQFTSVS